MTVWSSQNWIRWNDKAMQILILANHSGGLYDFRKDLIAALKQHAEVSVAVPRNDRWDELQALADRVIELPIDRRGMNPARDAKLLGQYRAILKQLRPDLVLTYTIKPNIYGGFAARLAGIPYAVNITGLGTAFESGELLKKNGHGDVPAQLQKGEDGIF